MSHESEIKRLSQENEALKSRIDFLEKSIETMTKCHSDTTFMLRSQQSRTADCAALLNATVTSLEGLSNAVMRVTEMVTKHDERLSNAAMRVTEMVTKHDERLSNAVMRVTDRVIKHDELLKSK